VNAVETAGLGKRYGRTWALRDCALAIPQGRIAALVGPNGAGKTTLLHTVTGLVRPTSGAATVLGGLPAGSLAALDRVAFVAQDAPLYGHLPVADMTRLARNLNDRWDGDGARARLDSLGIPSKAKVGKLSGGQQAQLALTLALARQPDLLVLDEPLARLDPLARHDFMAALMTGVAEEGTSVLFSSHVVSELERVCDYLVVLSRGRVQVAGDVEELLASHRVLTGPASGVADIQARFPVVQASTAITQAHLMIRTTPRDAADSGALTGWDGRAPSLEELVLAYLRDPGASALPGPRQASGGDLTELAS